MLLDVIRNWQISQMEKGTQIMEALLADIKVENMITYRDSGEGWTVLEVLCHLRDFEEVFHHRAILTVEQDNPELPFPDHEALVTENRYNEQDVTEVLAAWKKERAAHIEFMKARNEDDWERPAQHRSRGKFTLIDQLFLTVWHDTNHLEQITRILAEKR
jgi:DinB family protein